MTQTDKSFSVALAVFIHLVGVSFLVLFRDRLLAEEEAVAPELDVASMELLLTTLSNEAPGSPAAAGASAPASSQPAAEALPAPTLEVPQPADPVPLPTLPDKPSFDEALTPPPEPSPVPEPVVLPATAALPEPVKPAASAPAGASEARPAEAPRAASSDKGVAGASGGGGEGPATLQPGGGGGYGRVDGHPSLERAIKPNYPIGARRRGEEGTVVLDVTVTAEGRARSVSLVSSCGFAELDGAAERAAAQARFKPGTRNGSPVESAARLTIIFRLRDQ